jgi:L-2-hydroxyglutarate oxidase
VNARLVQVPASTAMPMQQTSITRDFVVVGGGVIRTNIARGLKKCYPTSKVTLIEKEASCGMHASSRNSGVLHAGFYYSPDSLKAKFTRDGNAQLTAYCREIRISLNRCGKLVVAKDAADLPALDELLKRGKANGIKLEELVEQDVEMIEPRAKTHRRAIFSPTTPTVDPNAVLQAMVADAELDGIWIKRGVAFSVEKLA